MRWGDLKSWAFGFFFCIHQFVPGNFIPISQSGAKIHSPFNMIENKMGLCRRCKKNELASNVRHKEADVYLDTSVRGGAQHFKHFTWKQ